MATIVTRSGKGSPLTWNELDANFTNINNELLTFKTGTFVPTVYGVTTAGVGTYTNQLGNYSKIGNTVTFSIYLNWTAHTGTGYMRIAALPYNPTPSLTAFSVWYHNLTIGAGKQLTTLGSGGDSYIRLLASDPAGGTHLDVNVDTAGYLVISGSYITA